MCGLDESLPEKTLDNYEQLKCIRMSHFKENLIGLIDGYDACSKLSVLNFKTNQVGEDEEEEKSIMLLLFLHTSLFFLFSI